MTDSNLPPARYSIWQCVSAALVTAQKALTEVRALARVPGPPGKDALQPDSIAGAYDHQTRTLMMTLLKDGAVFSEFAVKLTGLPVRKGIWREGAYEMGDIVTWGGSEFTAMKDTTGKPESSQDWMLSVKRGRDGKNAEPGKPNPIPIVKLPERGVA